MHEPYLHAISLGRCKRSLLFDIQIGENLHKLKINRINKTSVNLECVEKDCYARHNFQVDPKYVIECVSNKDGKIKSKFALDITNPDLRNVTNWSVKYHYSKPHKQNENVTMLTIPT